ncbi:MAG: patatin-like phospholipase family protein [Acidobacteria bacterium]|nr:patatin-like phospholipase family protein [Acidobacteriota bacterium]
MEEQRLREQIAEGQTRKGKLIKILSIDGGGIRGVIPAMILHRIEEKLKKPIAHVFDYIAGTSTGGVISLLLAKPKPGSTTEPMYSAEDIIELYTDHGRDMFRRSRGYQMQTLNGWLRNKYPEQSVLSTLQGYLDRGERSTMKEALTKVFLTSYDIERRRHVYLRSYGSVDFYMSDAARATAAAPAYFPSVKITNTRGDLTYHLIDGGLVANNPSLMALADAIRMNEPGNKYLVVSLGTGSYEEPIRYQKARRRGLFGWAPGILDVMFDGVNGSVEEATSFILDGVNDFGDDDFRNDRSLFFRFQVQLGRTEGVMMDEEKRSFTTQMCHELEGIDDPKIRRALELLREELKKEVVVGETKKYADDKLDNYDPENIRTLQKLTDDMLKENQSDFEDLLGRLSRSDSSIGYERAGNGVKTFGANA